MHRDEVPLGHHDMDVNDLARLDGGYDEGCAAPEELGPGGLALPAEPRQVRDLQAQQVRERPPGGLVLPVQFHVHEQERGRREALPCLGHVGTRHGAVRHGHHRYDHCPSPYAIRCVAPSLYVPRRGAIPVTRSPGNAPRTGEVPGLQGVVPAARPGPRL